MGLSMDAEYSSKSLAASDKLRSGASVRNASTTCSKVVTKRSMNASNLSWLVCSSSSWNSAAIAMICGTSAGSLSCS
ncbi:hypothetical protein ACFPRL_10115 [Pseudoclavibacter helvolus]